MLDITQERKFETQLKDKDKLSQRLIDYINNLDITDKKRLISHIKMNLLEHAGFAFFAGYLAGSYQNLDKIPEKLRNLYFKSEIN